MPSIRCIHCGKSISIDDGVLPYKAQLTCPDCEGIMRVMVGLEGDGATVEPVFRLAEGTKP